MKTLEFDNEETKKEYQLLATNHKALDAIINLLQKEYPNIKIMKVFDNTCDNQVILGDDENLITLYIDLFSKVIKVADSNKTFITVYDDVLKKNIQPIGVEYYNEDRFIFRKNLSKLSTDFADKKYYTIYDDDNKYDVILNYVNNMFNEEEFVKYIFDCQDISSIRKLFIYISKFINFNLFDLKIVDTKGSIIIVEEGTLTKYVEIEEQENDYAKIYLEKDTFFIEKKVKTKYYDDNLRLVKKIGERNGKEKE